MARTDGDSDGSGENPLLSDAYRIRYDRVRADHVRPAVDEVLGEARGRLERLAGRAGGGSWQESLGELEAITHRVEERLSPLTHLLSVAETKELRQAYNEVLPEITRFWSGLFTDEGLWRVVRDFAGSDEARELDPLRRRHLEKTLREFRRSGAELDPGGKERFEAIQVELSRLERTFSENVLDATAAYRKHVTDPGRLEGIPERDRERFRRRAEEEGKEGWLLTLDHPSVEAVLKHAEDRDLREEIQREYVERCRKGEYDNRGVILEILKLRRELADLLGYPGFPDYRLEESMVGSGRRAGDFVREMTERTRPFWHRDVKELQEHARALGLGELKPWDVAFITERLRRERYRIDDEELRPYFPLDRVLSGLFQLAERLFGVRVVESEAPERWHPDVGFFELRDEDGTLLGSFYTDWFPREEKRQGAWMNPLRTGGPREDRTFQPHLGFMAGNFTPPDGEDSPLLTHREVQTIFHEFGHLLHHLTSQVSIPSRSGLNVAWDFVELPSQLMENWTWEREALDLFARHHETGEPMPEDMFQRLTGTRHFMGGWQQMRQLGFGTLDLALHNEFEPGGGSDVMTFAREVLEPLSPGTEFAERHILTVFSHLFAGGYASAYYSYLWSEVLDADAYTRFRERGVFDEESGRRFRHGVLAKGDAEEADVLFRRFMGRDPDPEALLRRNLGPLDGPGTGAATGS